MKRRTFLQLSCGLGAGLALSGMGGLLLPLAGATEGLTRYQKVKKAARSSSVCCYCAVGCGLVCSTDTQTGQIIHVEGDPEHPINEGTLCAKGAGILQTSAANERRLDKVLYRAPFSGEWVEKDWDFAVDRIARNLKKERDAAFMVNNAKGQTVNRLETVAHLGSSNVDSEECWAMTVYARSAGLVYIDHQARV